MGVKSPLIIKSDGNGNRVAYKQDYLLPTGSFKYREAYAIMCFADMTDIETVILASSGNTHRAVKMLLSNMEVISFLWGTALSRIEATKCAIDLFRKYDPSKTLLLSGHRHPIKVLAHTAMARELVGQLHAQNYQATHYFQATGSGYGCRAVGDIIGGSMTPIAVRPSPGLDLGTWAPALTDAPHESTLALGEILYVDSHEIQDAWEFIGNEIPKSIGEPLPGLEAAVALAGCRRYLKAHPNDKIQPVVNLTGQLRGKLPW